MEINILIVTNMRKIILIAYFHLLVISSGGKTKRTTNLWDVIKQMEALPKVLPDGRFARAYNNPYHPEDDLSESEPITGDDEGLNRTIRLSGELTEAQTPIKLVPDKKLKVNGKYFDVSIVQGQAQDDYER